MSMHVQVQLRSLGFIVYTCRGDWWDWLSTRHEFDTCGQTSTLWQNECIWMRMEIITQVTSPRAYIFTLLYIENHGFRKLGWQGSYSVLETLLICLLWACFGRPWFVINTPRSFLIVISLFLLVKLINLLPKIISHSLIILKNWKLYLKVY